MGKYIELAALLLAVLMSALLTMIFRRAAPGQYFQNIGKGMMGHDYGRLSARLRKSGMAENLTPRYYRLLQCLMFLGVFLFLLMGKQSVGVSLSAGVCMMFVPEVLLKIHSKAENKRMLSDIEHIYNLLHLQDRAGAFFLDSLIDSYRVVSYGRLKKALIRLTADISAKKPIQEATEEFAAKFDNPYLSTLADIIRYGVEDGNTNAMIADVAQQIQAIQQARYIAEEGKQEAESLVIMTLLFIGILAAVMYLGAGALGDGGISII